MTKTFLCAQSTLGLQKPSSLSGREIKPPPHWEDAADLNHGKEKNSAGRKLSTGNCKQIHRQGDGGGECSKGLEVKRCHSQLLVGKKNTHHEK